jgi:DNA-binding NtrC family response regulator
METMVRDGGFREDLYYRLKVMTIHAPPLRERKKDIPILVTHLLKQINQEVHREVFTVPEEAMRELESYEWRGNVRELENFLTRAVILSKGKVLELPSRELREGPSESLRAGSALRSLEEVEAEHIGRVLGAVNWHQGRACEVLGVSRPTLRKKIRLYGLKEAPMQR